MNSVIPAELQRIVGKALRKDPERRDQVMKDLLLDLKALRDEVVSSDRSQPPAEASTASLTEDMTCPVSTGKYGVSRRDVRTCSHRTSRASIESLDAFLTVRRVATRSHNEEEVEIRAGVILIDRLCRGEHDQAACAIDRRGDTGCPPFVRR